MTVPTLGLLSPIYVGLVLAGGAYFVALLDGWFGAKVARREVRAGALLLAPLSRAALLVVRSRTSTERPDAEAWALAPALLGALGATAVVVVPVGPAVAVADVPGGIVLFGAAIALVMVAVEAKAVLTTEQLETLEDGMAMMSSMVPGMVGRMMQMRGQGSMCMGMMGSQAPMDGADAGGPPRRDGR